MIISFMEKGKVVAAKLSRGTWAELHKLAESIPFEDREDTFRYVVTTPRRFGRNQERVEEVKGTLKATGKPHILGATLDTSTHMLRLTVRRSYEAVPRPELPHGATRWQHDFRPTYFSGGEKMALFPVNWIPAPAFACVQADIASSGDPASVVYAGEMEAGVLGPLIVEMFGLGCRCSH